MNHGLFTLYVHLAHLVTPGSVTALSLAKRLENFATYDGADKHYPIGGDYPTAKASGFSPEAYAPRLVGEGYLDILIEHLKTGDPILGTPQDPLASTADVVSDAAATLGISTGAARYFLQLLALANPTDTAIKKWNHWTKKQLDDARNELITHNLVIEAARTGAGRTVFLPGGWLHKSDTGPGLEVWKTPHYLLWKAPKTRPIIPGCPPLLPYPRLFTEVWQRYETGDKPTYDELAPENYHHNRKGLR